MADKKKVKRQQETPMTPERVILQRRRSLRDRALLLSVFQKLLVLLLVVLTLFVVFFGITPMKGDDMEPRLSSGDLLLYYRMEKDPARNDVAVMERDGTQYVGRLVGMPGDTLIIKEDGTIRINDNDLVETDIYFETRPYEDGVRYPIVLEDDEYFLLADKRDSAKDSRFFGPVKAEEIKGKVITCIRRVSL